MFLVKTRNKYDIMSISEREQAKLVHCERRMQKRGMTMAMNFSDVKVYNEIELCEVEDVETKEKIEKALLKERVSFFIRWKDKGFWSKLFGEKEPTGVICVNDLQREAAEACVKRLEKEENIQVKFLLQKVDKVYF